MHSADIPKSEPQPLSLVELQEQTTAPRRELYLKAGEAVSTALFGQLPIQDEVIQLDDSLMASTIDTIADTNGLPVTVVKNTFLRYVDEGRVIFG